MTHNLDINIIAPVTLLYKIYPQHFQLLWFLPLKNARVDVTRILIMTCLVSHKIFQNVIAISCRTDNYAIMTSGSCKRWVSGQNTASRNTRGRKTIGHKTTKSKYQTVKIPDGQNTRRSKYQTVEIPED